MSNPERSRETNLLMNLESSVTAGELTREGLNEIRHQLLAPGVTVGDYAETNITFNRWQWDEEERLVPSYKKVTRGVELNFEEQRALRQKVQETGETPQELIKKFLRGGLGLSDKDNS